MSAVVALCTGLGVIAAAIALWPRAQLALPGLVPANPGAVPLSWLRRRREPGDIEAALPGFLEELARALRSGHSIRVAIELASTHATGALASDLSSICARLDHGVVLQVVLRDWVEERSRVRALQLVAMTIRVASTAGDQLLKAVDGVADTIRAELAVRAEVRALASQARASALLVVALPVVFGLVAGVADPRTAGFLFTTELGVVCLVGGLALNATGWLWMRRITGAVQ